MVVNLSRRARRLGAGFGAGLGVMAMLGWAAPAGAQGVVRSTHEDWQLRCETPAGARAEQCALVQYVAAEDRPSLTLVVIVLKTADGKSRLMRIVAPLGILLLGGVGLKIDQADVGRAPFARCLSTGCVAEVAIDDNLLSQLRTGQTATFVLFQTPEEAVGIPLALGGFGAGFDSLP